MTYINELVGDKQVHQKYPTPYGDVYINYTSKVAGIMLSGGLDSAVVLCLLADTFTKNNIDVEIRPMTVTRHNPTGQYPEYDMVRVYPWADTIIEYARKRYPQIKIHNSIKMEAPYWWVHYHDGSGNVSSYSQCIGILGAYQHWEYGDFHKLTKEEREKYTPAYIEYDGVTMNPPEDSDLPPSDENFRDTKSDKEIYPGAATVFDYQSTTAADYHVFRNADKRITMYLGDQLGVLDDLLNITRTCEGNRVETDNFTKDCKQCWWCLEKYWALENYEKPETSLAPRDPSLLDKVVKFFSG